MARKIRKCLTAISIISLLVIVGILISAIFGAKVFNGLTLKILLTCALLTTSSAFSITALGYYSKKRIISIVTLCSLAVLSTFVLIIIWTKTFGIFAQITLTLAIATILFCIIISNNIKLEKRFFKFQILSYIIIGLADIYLTMVVWGLVSWKKPFVIQSFVINMILAFAVICILGILSRRNVLDEPTKPQKDTITIKKEEYEMLKTRIAELEAEIETLKSQKE